MGFNTETHNRTMFKRVKYLGELSFKWDIFIKHSSQGLGAYMEEEVVRARGDGLLQDNSVFQTQQDRHTESVPAAHTIPTQVQD